MPTADEAQSAISLGNTLGEGLRALSLGEKIPFVQYIRYVLPLDGYVFWIATQQTVIEGSLHVKADKQQREDETIAVNRVILSTLTEIQEFNTIGPDTIWVGAVRGIRFAFSQTGPFYRSAREFHYSGDAVYPALESQLLELGAQLPLDTLIVSNSLPAWLSLKTYAPIWLTAPNPCVTLYPSFAVPDNIRPPYGSVHIAPDATRSWQAAPLIGPTSSHWQLTIDRVVVTLYGLTNAQAMAFVDLVYQYSLDTAAIGMTGEAIVRDGKRTQTELGVLAMQKLITYDVSYNQSTMRNVARQLLRCAPVTVTPQPYAVEVI